MHYNEINKAVEQRFTLLLVATQKSQLMSYSNPYTQALTALTSEDAKDYYAVRAQQDIGLIIWAIASACEMAYTLGYDWGTTLFDAVEASQPKPIAALPPVKEAVEETVKTVVEAIAQTDATLEATREDAFLKLTKAQLMDRCVARGLTPKKSYTKARLVEMLNASYRKVKPHQTRANNGRVVNIA